MTGWNLPPGCTTRMIDEAAGVYDICDCCGKGVEDCICPECPTCSEYGNPKCYKEHGLKFNREQLIGQTLRRIADLQEQVHDAQMYLCELENTGGEEPEWDAALLREAERQEWSQGEGEEGPNFEDDGRTQEAENDRWASKLYKD
jgi:hypothetical protein